MFEVANFVMSHTSAPTVLWNLAQQVTFECGLQNIARFRVDAR